MYVTGSLKFDISVTPELAVKAITLRRQWAPHRPVWIATSTHEGEESIILQAHTKLLRQFPDLLLILVPRHPERFAKAKELTQKLNFAIFAVVKTSFLIRILKLLLAIPWVNSCYSMVLQISLLLEVV